MVTDFTFVTDNLIADVAVKQIRTHQVQVLLAEEGENCVELLVLLPNAT